MPAQLLDSIAQASVAANLVSDLTPELHNTALRMRGVFVAEDAPLQFLEVLVV